MTVSSPFDKCFKYLSSCKLGKVYIAFNFLSLVATRTISVIIFDDQIVVNPNSKLIGSWSKLIYTMFNFYIVQAYLCPN